MGYQEIIKIIPKRLLEASIILLIVSVGLMILVFLYILVFDCRPVYFAGKPYIHDKDDCEEKINTPKHGLYFIPNPELIKLTSTKRNEIIKDISPPPNIPQGTIALIASITTHQKGSDEDHAVHSFGRNPKHELRAWSNSVHDVEVPYNDVIITHERSSVYGHSQGTMIIPLKENGRFDAHLNMGYNRGSHYITIQVYGYVK